MRHLLHIKQLICLVVLVAGIFVSGVAQADSLVLACAYSNSAQHSAKYSSSLYSSSFPRVLEIDTNAARVRWNDSDASEVNISEHAIEFARNGFQYRISRLTGEIRFSSPSELARWRDYRKKVVPALMAQGRSPAQAHAELNRQISTEFTAQEHVGNCTPA